MSTYFVVYRQPYLYKANNRLTWSREHKTRKADDDARATSWKDEVLSAGSVKFKNRVYKRELIRFAQENGVSPRILAGT